MSKAPMVRLGDLLLESRYGTSTPGTSGGTVPVVGIPHIRDGRVLAHGTQAVSLTEAEREPLRLQVGDILMTRTNSPELVGRAGIVDVPTEAVFASYLVRLRVDTARIDPQYLNYWLNSSAGQRQVRRLITRAVCQANVNPTELRKHVIVPVPPLSEQQRIASILATWDASIEGTGRLIGRKLVYRDLLTESLVQGGRSTPRDNRWVHLGEVASFTGKQIDPKGEPYRRMLHVGPENVDSGTGRMRGSMSAEERGLVSGKYVFDARSVVYSRIRPYLNKVCLPGFSGLCSSEMYPLVVDETAVIPEYLLAAMLSQRFLRRAIERTAGTGLPRIKWQDMRAIQIVLPSLEVQRRIAALFSDASREIEILQQLRDAYRRQSHALAANLFSAKAERP